MTTIFALSSGRPPAAIGIVRISGPAAMAAAAALAGPLPRPRHASLRRLRDGAGETLDHALVLVFPGPETATGEDLVELHLHGGRAVVAAVEDALRGQPDCRPAAPGEFTRRALENGRIDLTQAQGLADLLEAETQGQRRAALRLAEGALGRDVRGWLDRIAAASALIEAQLDFADETDVVAASDPGLTDMLARLLADLDAALARPPVERWKDGIRVVLAGPVNAGKSSLVNALARRDAAIVTDVPGTTRDVVEVHVVRGGLPFVLVDTAGLRDAADPVERIGVGRAVREAETADILLWLGPEGDAPPGSVHVRSRADLDTDRSDQGDDVVTSIHDPASIEYLWVVLAARATALLSETSASLLNREQRSQVEAAREALHDALTTSDPIIIAENLRLARGTLARIVGEDATEVLLDSLFGRFCIGK